eukprot:RCo041346
MASPGRTAPYLSKLIQEFLPRNATWATYESMLAGAESARPEHLRRHHVVNDDDTSQWASQYTKNPNLESSRSYFLRNLDRWYKGELVENPSYYRFQSLHPLPPETVREFSDVEKRKTTWKNPLFLARFMDSTGTIPPARTLKITIGQRKKISEEVIRARHLGLLPVFGNPYHKFLKESSPMTPFFSQTTSVHLAMQDFKQSVHMRKALEKLVGQSSSATATASGAAAPQSQPPSGGISQLGALLYGSAFRAPRSRAPATRPPHTGSDTAATATKPAAKRKKKLLRPRRQAKKG